MNCTRAILKEKFHQRSSKNRMLRRGSAARCAEGLRPSGVGYLVDIGASPHYLRRSLLGRTNERSGKPKAFRTSSGRAAERVRMHPHYSLPSLQEQNMADVSIRPKPNGPYLIEGPVDVYDTAGNKIATDDRPRIALCRCGASSNKPFCDGTHSKIGFQAAETINPESAEPQS